MVKPKKPVPNKFYGKCMRHDGTMVTLVAKAFTEQQACVQLHSKYAIFMVIDLLTEDEVKQAKNKRRGSLVGSPRLQ